MVVERQATARFLETVRSGYFAPGVDLGTPQSLSVMGRHFAVISRNGGLVDASIHTIGKFAWHQAFAMVRSVRIHENGGEPPLVAASSGFENYYHWTAETLGSMLMHRVMEPGSPIPMVIPEFSAGWQRQLLDLFQIENPLIQVERTEAVVFDSARLTNVTGRDYSFSPHPEMLREFRTQLRPLQPARSFGDLVYVARLDAVGRRQMINEAELCDMLRGHGFEIVVMGGLPVEEQAALFSRARVVIAPHGASFTNLLYCADGAQGPQVVELLQENYLSRGIAKLAQAKALNYTAVINPCVDRSDHHHSSNWRADIDLIERLVVERCGG